jgi:hypothetical protein
MHAACCGVCLVQLHHQHPCYKSSSQTPATTAAPAACRFYGGTESLVQAYKARGIESFGIIEHGACGYTLSDGTLAYQRDLYAALAGETWNR